MTAPAHTSTYREIRCESDGPVSTLTFARPDVRNALTAGMRAEIVRCLAQLSADDSVSVVVVAGANGSFCAGLDRDEMRSTDPDRRAETAASSALLHRAVVGFRKPLIAAVDGYALGTGFDLAVMCDVRIATARAVFGHPEVTLGGVPLYTPLADVLGAGWARALCLSDRRIDGVTAERIGLVTELAEPDALLAQAQQEAGRIAAVPLATLLATKALFADPARTERWLVSDHDAVFAADLRIR